MLIGTQTYGLTILFYCGGGAYGDVYLCQDASGRKLALKVISKLKMGAGWERELKGVTYYRTLAEDNPRLLKLYHVGEDENSFYYTMEPADALPECTNYKADTLAARLEHGCLHQEQLLPILGTILGCIRTLHEAGFAHRDIKPENILFIKGEPKLADLGLLSPLTGTVTQLSGTLDFLPPEERSGDFPSDSKESRQRNDIYAFGKLIYCCVTGNGANEYPSLPSNIPLTLHNKLLFRLAMRLCDKEPTMRLNQLSEVLIEFQRTVQICRHGERTVDKLRFVFSAAGYTLKSITKRSKQFCYRHRISAILMFCVLLGGGIWLAYAIATRPDKTSVELAQTFQEQKKIAARTDITKADYSFYDGCYSVAVPTDWQIFDHEAIVKARLPGDLLGQRLYGILVPKTDDGNANTVVSLMILPLTAEQLSALNDQEKIKTLKPLFADDVEAISIRQFKNTRLNLDTILFIGETQPSKVVVCYLYPRADHTLCLNALIPQEKFNDDMGKFLAITDSLVWRNPK